MSDNALLALVALLAGYSPETVSGALELDTEE